MKKLIRYLLIAISMCLFSYGLSAQEKNQVYYNSHEKEILPDARAAFRNGDYARADELCKWHYIIVGDNAADALRANAQRCSQLSASMKAYKAKGDLASAKKAAEALLTLNPNDREAKAILATKEPEPVVEPVKVEPPVEEEKPAEEVKPIETEQPAEEAEPTEVVKPADEPKPSEEVKPTEEVKPAETEKPDEQANSTGPDPIPATQPETIEPIPEPSPKAERMKVAAKAGVTVLDFSRFAQTVAPLVGVGLYDIAGSRFGAGLDAYIAPFGNNISVFGLDASAMFRAANGIYPKLFAGFFNCNGKDGYKPTAGMRIGAGVSMILARHICLDLGLSYFPAVKLMGSETVSTPDVSYEFPDVLTAVSGGISPVISVGWAF